MINYGGVRGTILVSVLAVSGLPVSAQDASLPRPGEHVRITSHDRGVQRVEGTLLELQADTIALQPATEASAPLLIPLSSLSSLHVRRHRSRAGTGARYGALVGGAVGVASAVLICVRKECEQYTLAVYAMFGALGGAAGALVGAVVGAIGGRAWEDVALDQLGLSIAPRPGGRFGIGVSLGF